MFNNYFLIISIHFFLSLIIPIILYINNWKWTPKYSNNILLNYFFILAKIFNLSISYMLILLIILLNLINIIYINKKVFINIIIFIFSILSLELFIKTYIKNKYKNFRPYILYIIKNKNIDKSLFFKITKEKQKKIIYKIYKRNILNLNLNISNSKYSFPSGHALLFNSIILTFIVITFKYKNYILLIFITILSNILTCNRILLGLHKPIDIIFSLILNYILFNILFLILLNNLI